LRTAVSAELCIEALCAFVFTRNNAGRLFGSGA
jgi:hypothetical protein